ncbi:MAG: hypothetical protein JEZ05_01075 [Tenericutes bacterium]|nr:hypothetical protein [Mycoplasmatota bacterium]
MKWMTKVLIVYLLAVSTLCAILLFSKIELDNYSSITFTLSPEALTYAQDNQLNEDYIDPVLEFISTKELTLLEEGYEVLYTAMSTNPYLYERNWSLYVEYSQIPDIDLQSSLFKDNNGVYYILAQYDMPLFELNQAITGNFIHFGFSDEYQVSNVYSNVYFLLNDEYTLYQTANSYDYDNKLFTMPTSIVDTSIDIVSVVGYVFLEIPVGNDATFFECSVDIFDGTNHKEDPGIILGFNKIVFAEREEYYSVAATWIKYRKEIS